MFAADLPLVAGSTPSVADLLDVDREFRRHAAADKRLTSVLHTTRAGLRYAAFYSNTPRAQQLGRAHDWVIVHVDAPDGRQHYTVVTERKGLLARRRVVRGREVECARHYHLPRHRFVDADQSTFGDCAGN